jgi:D-3-phosphoglycerate dehydrogenase
MRLAVFHLNVPTMIGKITAAVSNAGVNIENMVDRSRGNYAYCLLELSDEISDQVVAELANTEGIFRVRAIRK